MGEGDISGESCRVAASNGDVIKIDPNNEIKWVIGTGTKAPLHIFTIDLTLIRGELNSVRIPSVDEGVDGISLSDASVEHLDGSNFRFTIFSNKPDLYLSFEGDVEIIVNSKSSRLASPSEAIDYYMNKNVTATVLAANIPNIPAKRDNHIFETVLAIFLILLGFGMRFCGVHVGILVLGIGCWIIVNVLQSRFFRFKDTII